MIRVSLFGEFVLEDEKGRALKISTRKAQLLLAYLLLRADQPHPRERLIDLFWPDFSEERGKQSLRQAVYALRNVLEPDESSKGKFIIATPQTVQFLKSAPLNADAIQFDEVLKKCEKTSSGNEKNQLLQQAAEIYRGDLLSGCYDDWCLEDREYFRARYLNTLKELVQKFSQEKNYERAVFYARQSLKQDPLQEPIHYQLICIYAASGDRSAALQQYRDCEEVLKRELGVEPLPETQSLYQELQSRAAAPVDKQIGQRPSVPSLELGTPFVNRERELQRLSQALHEASQKRGRALLVAGEAGIGKSRLIQESLLIAARQKFLVLKSRCYDVEGRLPFQPVIEAIRGALSQLPKAQIEKIPERALREVVKLVPELEDFSKDLQPSAPLSAPDQERNRLFEGLRQFFVGLSGLQPVVIYLDDLQWADGSTLEFLHFFARHLGDQNILALGSYREEEVDESHPLWSILQHLIRDHLAEELRLEPLEQPHVRDMVRGLLKTDSLDDFGQNIYNDSKGFPFFVEEIVKSSIEDGTLAFDDDGGWRVGESQSTPSGVPSTVRALVGTRLRRVSPSGRSFLDLAAVSGHSFSPELMTQTLSGRQSEALTSIGELLERRFFEEQNEKYTFRHDLIRQVVYGSIKPERRRLLHLQVGEALEILHSETKIENGVLGDLALHFYNGQKWKKAMQYALAAGQQAWNRHYAKDEALRFYKQALEMAEKLEDKQNIMRAYKGMGEVCATTDEQDAGLEYCLKALELATEPEERAEIYGYIASVHHNKRNMEMGLEYCEKGLKELESQKKGLLTAKLYRQAATFLNWMRRFDEAVEYCERALGILRKQNDQVLVTRTLTTLGQAHSGKRNFDHAIEYLARAAKQAQEIDDPYTIGVAYFHLGISYYERDNVDEALRSWNHALAEIELLSGQHAAVQSLCNYMTFGYLRLGDIQNALRCSLNQLESAKLLGDKRTLSLSYGMLGSLLDCQGEDLDANKNFEQALQIAPGNDLLFFNVIVAYLYLNRVDKALTWFNRGRQFLKTRDLDKLKVIANGSPEYSDFLSQIS